MRLVQQHDADESGSKNKLKDDLEGKGFNKLLENVKSMSYNFKSQKNRPMHFMKQPDPSNYTNNCLDRHFQNSYSRLRIWTL